MLLGMTPNENQTINPQRPSQVETVLIVFSVGYVALLQNDTQNHTCFYICIHIYYTGKDFHTHGIPCE